MCLLPLPLSVVISTHMRTPSLSRKLLFANSEWNSDFQRVSLVSSLKSYLTKNDPSVCMLGLAERGFHIHSHLLGPKKNPQLAVLSLAPPSLNHIPSLPEPTLGGPSKPASTPPFPPVGRPNSCPHWTANSKNESYTTSPKQLKSTPPPVPVLTPVGEYTLFLCLAAQRTQLSHLPVIASRKSF